MNDFEFTLVVQFRQQDRTPRIPLTREDRRRLLGASLRILTYRHTAGIGILRADLTRVARLFADDAEPEVVGRLVLGADGSSPGP